MQRSAGAATHLCFFSCFLGILFGLGVCLCSGLFLSRQPLLLRLLRLDCILVGFLGLFLTAWEACWVIGSPSSVCERARSMESVGQQPQTCEMLHTTV